VDHSSVVGVNEGYNDLERTALIDWSNNDVEDPNREE
jgi:hypothetical protein